MTAKSYIIIDDKKIFVELAETNQEKKKGLMFRDELAENQGMLFIFNQEGKHSFWMKNTKIPLDIVFINKDLEIVDLLRADPCNEEPCKSYIPKKEALYVLEVNKNKFSEDIIGERILFKNIDIFD